MARKPTKGSGVGNKEGSMRPKITTYWSQEDVQDYFDWLKENYKKDSTLVKFVGEQLMGKAVQPIGNEGDEPFRVSGVEIIVRK